MRSIHTIALVAGAVFLSGCDNQSDRSTRASGPRTLTAIEHAAPLSRSLPAETVAYFRMPSFNDWLFEPVHAGLNNARALEANRAATTAVLDGLRDNVFGIFDYPVARTAAFLVTAQRSPLEIAILQPAGGGMIPDALIRTTITGHTADSLTTVLTESSEGMLTVGQPFDDAGHATFLSSGMPIYAHFDGTTLQLHGGLAATKDRLASFVGGQHETSSALADFERGIDESGRHLAAWVDVDRLWPMIAASGEPEKMAQMEAAGLNQIDYVWVGNASRGGRAETRMHVQMPRVGFRTLIPDPATPSNLPVAAPADTAIRFVLPSRAQFDAAVEWIIGLVGEEARSEWDTAIAEATEALGRDPRSLLDAYGPDLVVSSDAAGWWGGYRMRSAAEHESIEQWIQNEGWVAKEARTMGSLAITEMRMAANPFLDTEEMGELLPPEVISLLGRLTAPFFYHTDGEYLVTANIPQILAARDQSPRQPLSEWLAAHDLDWTNAVVAAATEVENSPRDVYHIYLYMLGYLSNVADAKLDLTVFPTASDLDLPSVGRLGFQIDSSAVALSAALSYETSSMEILLNSDLMTLYLIGIAAAVAIPAYEDYQRRAAGGDDSCAFANDGECDEPDICDVGTDVTDCGIGGGASGGPDSCVFAFDGACDEPDICSVGTDTTDCSGGGSAGPDSCAFANDGECDEPDICPVGTDTTDCGSGGAASGGPDSCGFANDGECDEPDLCSVGTDTTDCSGIAPAADTGPNSCMFANDGDCDEPNICAAGTDTADCSGPVEPDSCAFANDGECDEPDICRVGTDTTDCAVGGTLRK